MIPISASKILVIEGVMDDPRMAARAERLRAAIETDTVLTVTDAELARTIEAEALGPRHGMHRDIRPLVIFNRFRFNDSDEEKARRRAAWPVLARPNHKFDGYGGFDWRDSGSPRYRRETGLVCQPAWQIHTIVGCHFRCAYCTLGWSVNIFLNIEEYVERLDEELDRCPEQTLFQFDNFTDPVCFEPEYGATRLLIDYFARKPGKALELYVGKSDHVDFLLDYDHRGHTVCCWSLSASTQAEFFEYRSAGTSARIDAMRKCQKAGYPVRVRFSPIIPTRNWRQENRDAIRELFAKVRPDVVTMETIRFLEYPALSQLFDLEKLDPETVELMRRNAGQPKSAQGCELPDSCREAVYRFMIDEIAAVSPDTPICFCRERRVVWDHFADDLRRHGQNPDRYVCNCGPIAHPQTVGAW